MPIKSNAEQVPIKSMEVLLPSRGLLYPSPFPHPLVTKAFGFSVEDILLQPGNPLRKLAKIVETVADLPSDFDATSLLIGDLYVIIACARALTYGENYKFREICKNCGHPEIISIKVPEELPVQDWSKYANREALEKDMVLTLPTIKDTLQLQCPTIQQEIEADDFKRKAKAAGKEEIDSSMVIGVASKIASVNGGTPDNLAEAVAYVRGLRGPDKIALEDKLEEISPGITLAWTLACDACNTQWDAKIPLSQDFFRRNRA